jgi:hypothetical protein
MTITGLFGSFALSRSICDSPEDRDSVVHIAHVG